MARLVVVEGPWSGCAIALQEGEHVLGRDPACDLAVPDGSLSRRHACFRPVGAGWMVEDLGSSNGTAVNQQPVTQVRLRDGDVVACGRTVLRFEDRQSAAVLSPVPSDTTTVIAESPPAGGVGSGSPLAGLLELADRLLGADGEDAALERLVAWLRAVTGAARGQVFDRSRDQMVARAVFSAGGREAPRAAALPGAAVDAAAREGKALWLGETRDEGSILVPVGAPARLLVLLPATGPAPAPERLRLLACAGHLAAGLLATRAEVGRLQARVAEIDDSPLLASASPAMQEVREFLDRAADADSTVLLQGESGTGKEVIARALHQRGARGRGPFVAVNCAAITPTLLMAELFGHEKGAFTGAAARRAGRFEQADRGTILLDEIAELSAEAQAALLRVTEERALVRVGGVQPVPIDVRIIAASHRDLRAEAAAGRFRHDLMYRLSVLVVQMPPLRERSEDLQPLAEHLLAGLVRRVPRRIDGIAPEALAALRRYPWPGNVRELRNALERAVILGRSARIELADLPAEVRQAEGAPAVDSVELPQRLDELERRAILAAVRATAGNKSQAARLLGIDRVTLYSRLRSYATDDSSPDDAD